MKKTRLLAMILLFIVGLFISSCESVRGIYGLIVDEETHMPLSNVEVSWMGNHEMAVHTDSLGNFISAHVVRGRFKFYVEYSKEGYYTKTIEYDKWPKNKIIVELQQENECY